MYVSANLLAYFQFMSEKRTRDFTQKSILQFSLENWILCGSCEDFMWILMGFYANFVKFCTHFMHILLTLNNAVSKYAKIFF